MRGIKVAYYSKSNQWYLNKMTGKYLNLSLYRFVSFVNKGEGVIRLSFHNNGTLDMYTSALTSNGGKDQYGKCFTNDSLSMITMELLDKEPGPVNVHFRIMSMSKEHAELDMDMNKPSVSNPRKRSGTTVPVEQVALPAPRLFEQQKKAKPTLDGPEKAIRKLVTMLGRSGVLTNGEVRELIGDLAK